MVDVHEVGLSILVRRVPTVQVHEVGLSVLIKNRPSILGRDIKGIFGWWDGTQIQPVKPPVWWGGSAGQPLLGFTSGPRWAEVDPALTWDQVDPTQTWDDVTDQVDPA